MTTIRYAALTAVSTVAQAAADKVSLPEQLETCRDRAGRRGWIETAGPYTIPGQSRTRYVDLTKAEGDIPALRYMLDDARAQRFDVLVIYEFNRLRDLLDMVSTVLSSYGIQIFSATQPVEPMPPEEYRPYLSSAQDIMSGMSKIISKRQADDLKLKYQSGMNGRITRLGLSPSLPYGYKKPEGHGWNSKAVPVQDPDQIATIIHMKDMLLAGQSIRQIRDWLHESNILSPQGGEYWQPNGIRLLLLNPFYAGTVRRGMRRQVFDPRERSEKYITVPEDQVISGPGAHEPVWGKDVHDAIVAELAQRSHGYRGKSTQHLTGLARCGICGATMNRVTLEPWGEMTERVPYLRCHEAGADHIRLRNELAVELVAAELVARIHDTDLSAPAPQLDKVTQLQAEHDDLLARRKRLVDAYEAGLLDLADYGARRKEIDAKVVEIDRQVRDLSDGSTSESERRNLIEWLRANSNTLYEMITLGDRQAANHLLRGVLECATIHKDPETKEFSAQLTFK